MDVRAAHTEPWPLGRGRHRGSTGRMTRRKRLSGLCVAALWLAAGVFLAIVLPGRGAGAHDEASCPPTVVTSPAPTDSTEHGERPGSAGRPTDSTPPSHGPTCLPTEPTDPPPP